jgi:putative ABC transport system permease protein
VLALYDRTLTDLRALPGVEAAAVMSDLPLTRGLRLGMRVIDGPAAGGGASYRINVDWRYVTPEFLTVFRVPVIAGRAITERDAAGTARAGGTGAGVDLRRRARLLPGELGGAYA